jgi:hypothetical protein
MRYACGLELVDHAGGGVIFIEQRGQDTGGHAGSLDLWAAAQLRDDAAAAGQAAQAMRVPPAPARFLTAR